MRDSHGSWAWLPMLIIPDFENMPTVLFLRLQSAGGAGTLLRCLAFWPSLLSWPCRYFNCLRLPSEPLQCPTHQHYFVRTVCWKRALGKQKQGVVDLPCILPTLVNIKMKVLLHPNPKKVLERRPKNRQHRCPLPSSTNACLPESLHLCRPGACMACMQNQARHSFHSFAPGLWQLARPGLGKNTRHSFIASALFSCLFVICSPGWVHTRRALEV